jgi:hypothetical protein
MEGGGKRKRQGICRLKVAATSYEFVSTLNAEEEI